MKFQNPSFDFFLNGRTDGQTTKRMDGQAESNMLPTFSSWGHKKNWEKAKSVRLCQAPYQFPRV